MRAPRPARESRLTDWEAIQQWAKAEVGRLRAEPDTDPWAAVRTGTWPTPPKEGA